MAATSGPTSAWDGAGALQCQFDHSGYRTAAAPMMITAASAPSTRLCRSRINGKATADAAIAAMTAAMTRNVLISFLVCSWSGGGLIVHRHARTMAHDPIDDEATQQQHDERSAPNEQGFGFERGAEAHELTIAVRHEIEYRVIALAGDQHLAHLLAKIDGKFGIRVGNGLDLTDETAKFQGYSFEALLQSLILELAIGVHRLIRREGCEHPHDAGEHQHGDDRGASPCPAVHAPSRRAAAIRGKNSRSHTCCVMGEMNL